MLQDNNKQLDKGIRKKEKANKEQVANARQELATVKQSNDKEAINQKEAELKALTTITSEIKEVKDLLEALREDRKRAEYYFNHIDWLQQRFPKAQYEDVTGLCKLATPEEVKEQDYSLNAGRYVGVVIEEDGRTEEEFIEYMQGMNEDLIALGKQSLDLESIIQKNMKELLND